MVLLCYDFVGHKLLGLRLHNPFCNTTLEEKQGQDNSDWFISFMAVCTKIELLCCKIFCVNCQLSTPFFNIVSIND